jgi:broad specificity polyphosphatase/5'/3'-nucleotidase SurE
MPREISDQEHAYYENRRMVADFVESIYNDPALNKEAKKLIKKKYPNLQIPDYDIEEKVEARFAQEKQARDTSAAEKRKKDEDEKWKADRKAAQDKYHYNDEDMKKLEKMMVELEIPNYDVAATYMRSQDPAASEPANESRFWRHDQQDGFAEIAKDPEKWGEKEILRALREDQARARNGWR